MENQIEKRVELQAPVSRVWRALTDYREFGKWFRVALEGPFVPGKVARGRVTHPGYEHVITLTPTEAGEFGIICNEFCGIGHHTMTGKIYVKDPKQAESVPARLAEGR